MKNDYYKDALKALKSKFDLGQIERDCITLRKEKAGNGEYVAKLTSLKIFKVYDKPFFVYEFRTPNDKVITKTFDLTEFNRVEDAIRFLYSLNLLENVTYDTFFNDLRKLENLASLYTYNVSYYEDKVNILGKKLKC